MQGLMRVLMRGSGSIAGSTNAGDLGVLMTAPGVVLLVSPRQED